MDESALEVTGTVDGMYVQPPEFIETEEQIAVRHSSRVRNSLAEWWKTHSPFVAVLSEQNLTYSKAILSPERALWEKAVGSKMDSLQKTITRTLFSQESARKLLREKWMFKTKDFLSSNAQLSETSMLDSWQ